MAQPIAFTTLSNIVSDELQFPGKVKLVDVVGGPGAYAILGARLLLPPPLSHTIGWLVYVGLDFPSSLEAEFTLWDMNIQFLRHFTAKTARGLLTYEDDAFGTAHFTEISPPLRLSSDMFFSTPLLSARIFHILGTPEMVKTQIPLLHSLRQKSGIEERAIVLWEPETRCCMPENRAEILSAAKLVDVISPNHIELGNMFGGISGEYNHKSDKLLLEGYARSILESGVGLKGTGAVIVRAAQHGCFALSHAHEVVWVPAYYDSKMNNTKASVAVSTEDDSSTKPKVVDPTGAGNAFLGGFAVGFEKTRNLSDAMIYGTISASFVLEQTGFPRYEPQVNSSKETWNGVDVQSRLQAFTMKLEGSS